MVAIISGASAWFIGFLLGALFTAPQNKEMEVLVNGKTEMVGQINALQTETQKLQRENENLKKENQGLKDKLIMTYEVEKETKIF